MFLFHKIRSRKKQRALYENKIFIRGLVQLKKRFLLTLSATIMMGVVLLMSGCSNPITDGSSTTGSVEAPQSINYEKSDAITADIYLDGTTSMYGYVNYPGGTIYGDAVKNIERTITENWKNDTINYIKFGDTFQEMSRDAFLQMDTTAFYDQKDTSLQKVIEQTKDKDLSIIITDLFQTNQDLDSLVHSIKNKGMGNDRAVAVIGLKSQFNGKIFDVGKNMSSLDYASSDDPSTYRPVYLIVLGSENDTRAFVESYQKKLPESAQANVAFFAPNLGIHNALEADKVTNKKSDKKDKAAKMATISNLLGKGDIMQYRLKKDEKLSEAPVRLYGKDVIGKIPDAYTLKLDSVEVWNKGGKIFESTTADDFLSADVGDTGLNNGTANISFMLQANPAAIHKKEGVYRAKISLVSDKDKYTKAVNSFADWNFDDSQISESQDALKSVGNKTLNISKFITILANLNYELNTPGFHDIYVYFEVK